MQSGHHCSTEKESQIYLKDVLEFNELDNVQKEHKRAQGQRLLRGAAGTTYGNPAYLLDAANYVKCVVDAITSTTISNAFKKAEIIKTLQNEEEEQTQNENSEDDEEISEVDEEFNDMFADLIQDLASLNINVTEDEMNRFLNADK